MGYEIPRFGFLKRVPIGESWPGLPDVFIKNLYLLDKKTCIRLY